jgi:hypothetical protein
VELARRRVADDPDRAFLADDGVEHPADDPPHRVLDGDVGRGHEVAGALQRDVVRSAAGVCDLEPALDRLEGDERLRPEARARRRAAAPEAGRRAYGLTA